VSVLRINISNLSEGTHHRSLEASPEEIGLDNRFSKTIHLEATLEKTSRQLFLQVELKTGGVFACDRCLDEVEKEIVTTYHMMYLTDDQGAIGKDVEEVQVISPDANHIDLNEDVRQFAILALPQKMLCRENCAGLCANCGTNLNRATCDCRKEEVDARWAGLKGFLEN